MNRRGFFKMLAGLAGGVAAAPLLKQAAEPVKLQTEQGRMLGIKFYPSVFFVDGAGQRHLTVDRAEELLTETWEANDSALVPQEMSDEIWEQFRSVQSRPVSLEINYDI